MNFISQKSVSITTGVCLLAGIGMGLSLYAKAGDRMDRINWTGNEQLTRRIAQNDSEGTQQTLNLNFSPEDRVRLRRALDDYARSVDPDHDQIEERRRAMQESVEERFMASDKDNDGSIDRQEATESLPQVARHFSQFDTNQDELITLDELEDAQNRFVERRKAAEAALEAQKQAEIEAAVAAKRKSKQAFTNSRKRSL